MSELKKRAEFNQYDSMTTEELQEILRKHAHGELQTEPDTGELYHIMEVLAQRREINKTQAFRSDLEALSDFCKNHIPQEKTAVRPQVACFRARAFRTVAAVLAVMLVLVMGTTITAHAFNFDIWGKFGNWTKEIFQFTDTPQDTTVADPMKEYNAELNSLRDALNDHMIVAKLAPTWLPEGYVNKEIKINATPRVVNISAIYEKNGTELIIKICQTIGTPSDQIEKNDDLLEVYVVDGIEYYIFSNTETLQAAWSIGEFECIMIGKIPLEEMKRMIDSIR